MTSKRFEVVIFLIFVLKVFTVFGQSALKQYFHVTGIGSHPQTTAISVPNVGVPPQAVSNAGLSALSALALPSLIQALTSSSAATNKPTLNHVLPTYPTQQTASAPTSTSKPNPPPNQESGGIDASVLNNLAIALQLMIVNNILNSNLPENESSPIYDMLETVKNAPGVKASSPVKENSVPGLTEDIFKDLLFDPRSYQESHSLQNSNFVGTSGFGELMAVSDPYTKHMAPRNSYQLMSPYEALGPNSPFSDPILSSPYGSIISSKKDFQSPYLMMDSDPFPKNDFF